MRSKGVLMVTAIWLTVTTAIAAESHVLDAIALSKAPESGLCAIVGQASPKEIVRLAKAKPRLMVFIQLYDAKNLDAIRRHLEQSGLLGSRVFIASGSPVRIGLADDLADLVILNGKAGLEAQADAGAIRREALRVARPGGTVVIDLGNIAPQVKLTKAFPADTDEWSHPYHGPDNNPQSTDKKAHGPFLTHFMAEPWYAAMPQMTVISGGRIFKVWGNRSSKQPSWRSLNTLICLNAFNGATLWRRKLKPGFLRHRNTLIATPETLYFADDRSCQLIDPATGKTRDEIIVSPDVSNEHVWCWMALQDGVLYALLGKEEPKVEVAKWRPDFRGAGWPWWRYKQYAFGFGKTVLAIDPKTKKVLWRFRADDELDMRAMCMRGNRIYFYSLDRYLGCLDATTGKLVWKSSDPKVLKAIGKLTPAQNPYFGFITTSYVKCSDDALFFAGPMCKNLLAVSAKNGKLLWVHEGAGNSQLVLRREALYALGGGRRNEAESSLKLDPLSGKILARFPSRDRCTRATGCLDAIFTRGGRGGSTAVFDVTSTEPKMGLLSPMRPACQDGVTIAHGYLFWGPWMCRCDYTQIGVISLGPAGRFDFGAKANEKDRLIRFPRWSEVDGKMNIDERDWPAFRHDNRRSTRTKVAIPREVTERWVYRSPVERPALGPVTVGNRVYVAGADGAVRCLDGRTGKVLWTVHTGGDIKYPPAIADSRLYVGSGDGWVYCFDATTGRPLWQFRAAPIERRIPIFGSLLSTWPVGSGVLVDNGAVYAAAGNANYNGTHVYALDAKTGRIRWQNNDSGHRAGADDSGAGVQGHFLLNDDELYMQGGNLTGIVSYRVTDGKFARRGRYAGRYGNIAGKDLYVLRGQVHASGLPLYFRPEDSHFIERAAFETPLGIVGVFTLNQQSPNPTVLVALVDTKSDLRNPKAIWKQQPFTENNAVAIAENAVIVAGINRDGVGESTKITSGVCAYDLASGKLLWRRSLPAQPTGWGIAIDRQGQVVISLQDGRVVALASK